MPSKRDFLTTYQVADVLGMESRQVRALAEKSAITRVAHGVFDRVSVERYLVERGPGRTRTWSEGTAWGAIALLSGAAGSGLEDSQHYRLKSRILRLTDPAELAIQLRDRAVVYTCSGSDDTVSRIRNDLVIPNRQRLQRVHNDRTVDGYVHADQIGDLVRRHHLEEDPSGAITLRSTGVDMAEIEYLIKLSSTLAAVDLSTSLDSELRGVGLNVLKRKLDLFRENSRR